VRPIAYFGLILFLITTATSAQEKPARLTIQNESLTVEWDPSGTFEVIEDECMTAHFQERL
jgi:hypothetical protein